MDLDGEEALNQWFPVVTGPDVRVSGPMLNRKSEGLAKKLDHNDFKATDGWDGIAEQWKSTKLPNLVQKLCADNICNADETGLLYRATTAGSLSYKHATLSGSKKRNGLFNCVVFFGHVRN
jgi:hypothetical protein